MEVEGGSDRKIAVLIYELVGTCILTYVTLISKGDFYSIGGVYLCLLYICWNVSGGHFNPALSISVYVGQKNFGGNIVTLAMMLGAQTVGAFLGLFWAWLTLMNKDYMKAVYGDDPDHLVPPQFLFDVCPTVTDVGCDTGEAKYGFSRDFQTFFAVLIVSIFNFFIYQATKNEQTANTDNNVVKMFVCYFGFTSSMGALRNFGFLGFNPLLTVMVVIFKVSQTDGTASPWAHYLWVYILVPIVAAGAAGILHLMHVKGMAKGDGGQSYE